MSLTRPRETAGSSRRPRSGVLVVVTGKNPRMAAASPPDPTKPRAICVPMERQQQLPSSNRRHASASAEPSAISFSPEDDRPTTASQTSRLTNIRKPHGSSRRSARRLLSSAEQKRSWRRPCLALWNVCGTLRSRGRWSPRDACSRSKASAFKRLDRRPAASAPSSSSSPPTPAGAVASVPW